VVGGPGIGDVVGVCVGVGAGPGSGRSVRVSTSALSYAVWAACLAVLLALWALSHWRPGLVARPAAAGSVLAAHRGVRLVVALGVMWLGWHLFAR
jgi:hypothetical protein